MNLLGFRVQGRKTNFGGLGFAVTPLFLKL